MKKKNIYIYVNPFFLFILQMYFHKNISLYKKKVFYSLTYSLFLEKRSLWSCSVVTQSAQVLVSPFLYRSAFWCRARHWHWIFAFHCPVVLLRRTRAMLILLRRMCQHGFQSHIEARWEICWTGLKICHKGGKQTTTTTWELVMTLLLWKECKVSGNKNQLFVTTLLYYTLDKLDILFFIPLVSHIGNILLSITAYKQRRSCCIADIEHSIEMHSVKWNTFSSFSQLPWSDHKPSNYQSTYTSTHRIKLIWAPKLLKINRFPLPHALVH